MGHVSDETVLGIAARDNSGHLSPFQFTRRYYSTNFVCFPSLPGRLLLCFWPLLCHTIVIFFRYHTRLACCCIYLYVNQSVECFSQRCISIRLADRLDQKM